MIDARGTTVMPGLIDSHVHPVFGDFTPRQRTVDFLDSGIHGGVTTAISAGEVHLPGRPEGHRRAQGARDRRREGLGQLPAGRCEGRGGAPILELGLTEADFAEMAAAGVKLVGEIGLGSVKTGKDAAPMVRVGQAARHDGHHPHRGPVHRGLEPDQRGRRAGGAARTSSATSTAARPRCRRPRSSGSSPPTWRSRSCSAATRGPRCTRCAPRRTRAPGPHHRGQRRAVGYRRDPAGRAAHAEPAGRARAACRRPRRWRARPATPRASTASTVGVVAEGREADLVICDAPIGRVARDALGALTAGDLPGISMVLVDGKSHRPQPQHPPGRKSRRSRERRGPAGRGPLTVHPSHSAATDRQDARSHDQQSCA